MNLDDTSMTQIALNIPYLRWKLKSKSRDFVMLVSPSVLSLYVFYLKFAVQLMTSIL